MSRLVIADLFSGAGGSAMGLYRAGFTVVGFDIRPQPHYPFEFHQQDAFSVDLRGFDAVWASPPCQHYSQGAARWKTQGQHPDLIAPARAKILAAGLPYIIENIAAARDRLIDPVLLCGEMFGLGVFRHRLFESNRPLPVQAHPRHTGKIGDGRFHTVTGHAGGSSKRDGWRNGGVSEWRQAMRIDWMTGSELAEAIPPPYAEYTGTLLIESMREAVAA